MEKDNKRKLHPGDIGIKAGLLSPMFTQMAKM